MSQLPDKYTVTAVANRAEDRRREAVDRLGCRAYQDFAAFAEADDVDLVVVATPSHLHAEHAVAALANGKHVLVEKPFTTSLREAEEVIAAAERHQRLAMASQNLRYTADFLKVREVLDSGVLGELLQVSVRRHAFRRRWDWQTLRAYGGGIISNDASHVVDQLLALLGERDPSVFCAGRQAPLSLGDAEDHVKIVLTAPEWPLVDVELSSACAYPQDQWLICGAYGSLTGGPAGIRWRYVDPQRLQHREVSELPTPDRSYNAETLQWVEREAAFPDETYGTSHVRLYEDIYQAVLKNEPADLDARSVRQQVAILDACRERVS
jgi:predicted dehydrogenase